MLIKTNFLILLVILVLTNCQNDSVVNCSLLTNTEDITLEMGAEKYQCNLMTLYFEDCYENINLKNGILYRITIVQTSGSSLISKIYKDANNCIYFTSKLIPFFEFDLYYHLEDSLNVKVKYSKLHKNIDTSKWNELESLINKNNFWNSKQEKLEEWTGVSQIMIEGFKKNNKQKIIYNLTRPSEINNEIAILIIKLAEVEEELFGPFDR